MSGTGAAVAPRMQHATLHLPHWDATHGCEPAVEAERAAAVDHIRAKIETAKRLLSTGRLGDDRAQQCCDGHLLRVLDELACDIQKGLHR